MSIAGTQSRRIIVGCECRQRITWERTASAAPGYLNTTSHGYSPLYGYVATMKVRRKSAGDGRHEVATLRLERMSVGARDYRDR